MSSSFNSFLLYSIVALLFMLILCCCIIKLARLSRARYVIKTLKTSVNCPKPEESSKFDFRKKTKCVLEFYSRYEADDVRKLLINHFNIMPIFENEVSICLMINRDGLVSIAEFLMRCGYFPKNIYHVSLLNDREGMFKDEEEL